jgi:integrase
MPRATTPLNDTQLRTAKPLEKEYVLSDTNGLGLRIRPDGSKDWILRYKKPHTPKRAKLSLGSYTGGMTLKQARDTRDTYLSLLADNVDPQTHRNFIKQKATFDTESTLLAVAGQWFEVKRSKVTADFALDIWRSLERHIFPVIGTQPLGEITAPMAISAIEPVAARGNLETVKRLCQRLNEIMTFAVNTGVIHHNPLAGIKDKFANPVKQHNPTLEPNQLPLLMETLHKASIKLPTRVMIEWQLHTMVRPGESAGTTWDEIDFDNSTWTIPPARMKKKREHIVPLSPQALALLEVMRPISGHMVHVFPSQRDPLRHANEGTPNVALKRMGFKDILTAHGMRALASTTLNEQSFDYDVIEMALAHIDSNETRRSYNHAQYLPRRKVMMEWWSQQIEDAATGNMSIAASTRGLRAIS